MNYLVLLLMLVVVIFLTGCHEDNFLPIENASCEQLVACYNQYNYNNCCLHSIDKPVKGWDCTLYLDPVLRGDFIREIINKCGCCHD
jgi:hypothetical protein